MGSCLCSFNIQWLACIFKATCRKNILNALCNTENFTIFNRQLFLQVRLKTLVDFVGDTLGHTEYAACAKLATQTARGVLIDQSSSLAKEAAKQLSGTGQQITSNSLEAAVKPTFEALRSQALAEVIFANGLSNNAKWCLFSRLYMRHSHWFWQSDMCTNIE